MSRMSEIHASLVESGDLQQLERIGRCIAELEAMRDRLLQVHAAEVAGS